MNAILTPTAAASGAAQRTLDWHIDRTGRITASRFKDAIAKTEATVYTSGARKGQTKAAQSKDARRTYMRELAFERLTKSPCHFVTGKALDWGTDTEPAGLEHYQLKTGNTVIASPFVLHPKYQFIGASPDGLVDDDPEGPGGTESKCPFSEHVHVRTWLEGMPEEHLPQVQGAMMCTGREWWDFISYDPRQIPELRLYVQRIYRDDAYIAWLEVELCQFEAEVNFMVKELLRRGAGLPTGMVADTPF